MRIILLALIFNFSLAENCTKCIMKGEIYCNTFEKCNWFPVCPKWTKKVLNCPDIQRENAMKFNDSFVRNKILITTAAAYSNDPQLCFNNSLPSMTLIQKYEVDCSRLEHYAKCLAYIAIDDVQKVIVIVFRGTVGHAQFFDAGSIYSYFYNAFMYIWTSGLDEDFRKLREEHPDYELWVNGFSLGGAIASVAASYIVKIGLFDAENIKLVTMGQPRTGDYDYATWHDETFPYTFRIVHAHDPVPHIPPRIGTVELFHHRTEIWYPKNMWPNAHYKICSEADGSSCSNSLIFFDVFDHSFYYSVHIADWGKRGCPK